MFTSLMDRVVRTSRRTRIVAVSVIVFAAAAIWAVVTDHVGLLIAITVATVGGGFLTKRMYAVHKVKRAKILAAAEYTRWPRLLAETLKLKGEGSEVVEYETRMHPVVIFYVKRVVILLLVAVAALVTGLVGDPTLLLVSVASLLVMIISVVPRAINWWFTRRCFTNRRVIVVTGVLTKHYAAVALDKIETVSHDVPFISSILERLGLPGAWHWKFDTQVQNDPFNTLPWSVYPSPAGDILERYVVTKPKQ